MVNLFIEQQKNKNESNSVVLLKELVESLLNNSDKTEQKLQQLLVSVGIIT